LKAGVAGLFLSLVVAAPALAGPAVSLRVEGQQSTLLPRTPITLTDAPAPGNGCPADSAANAIEIGTQGNWDRQVFTQTILGEKHDFTNNDYWGIWVFRGGAYKVANGICTETLAAGEELLAAIQFSDPDTFENKLFPLWLTGVPSDAKPGVPFAVTVNRTACETSSCVPGEGHREPAAGATVTAGAATATADANGVATLTVNQRGPISVRATQADRIPAATQSSCVSDGSDGYCGYQIPTGPSGPGAGEPDTVKPTTAITGLRKRYKKGKGPRTLAAVITDAGGIADVKLAITRTRKGKCAGFGNTKGRFRKLKCGRRLLFSVGAKTDVSFLLPKRLGKGRYVFDVVATDTAGNRSELSQGFRVK
jgi:hypothetical protein